MTSPVPARPVPRGMHPCAAELCAKLIPHRLLMCPRHWGMVPREIQSQLWRAYTRADSDGRARLTKGYLAAVDACIEAVRKAEGPKQQQLGV